MISYVMEQLIASHSFLIFSTIIIIIYKLPCLQCHLFIVSNALGCTNNHDDDNNDDDDDHHHHRITGNCLIINNNNNYYYDHINSIINSRG